MIQTLGRVLLRHQQLLVSSSQHAAVAAAAVSAAAASAAGAQGLGLLSSIRLFSTEGNKRLYVGNLSWQTQQEDLAQYFGQYGEVQDCTIVRDRMGRSKGFGFIEMPATAAEEAISKAHDAEFQGRPLTVNVAQPPTDRDPLLGAAGGGSGERPRRGGGGGGGRGAPAGDGDASFAPREGCRRLYIGNLPYETKAHELAQELGRFGRVEDVMIPLDELGRSRGYAFVELDVEGAEAVMNQVDQTQLLGRTVFVRPAHTREQARGRRSSARGGMQDDSDPW